MFIRTENDKNTKIRAFLEKMIVFKLLWIKKNSENLACGIMKVNLTVFMTLQFKTKELTWLKNNSMNQEKPNTVLSLTWKILTKTKDQIKMKNKTVIKVQTKEEEQENK